MQSPDLQSTQSDTNHSPGNGEGQHSAQPGAEQAVSTAYARGTGWKSGILAIIFGIGLMAVFIYVQHRRSGEEKRLDSRTLSAAGASASVNVVGVKDAPLTQTLVLPGETRAWYESTIYGRVSGYVASWSADIGDRVKKGQVLAIIETPELDDQLIASKAKLKVSEADVAVMEANSALAKSNYDRWWDSPKGVVSEQEREEKKAEYDSSIARLNAAKSQINLDQADVDRLTEMAAFKQVRAPYDGVITGRRIDIGDLVTAGSTNSTTSLYSIAQSDQIRVFVDVPQSASVGMNVGLAAVASATEYPGRTFEGKIARNSRAIDPVARTLRVEVDIANTDLTLLPGMYLQVSFEVRQNRFLEVPASALLFRSAGPQVAVVGGDGQVNFHDVTIARDQGEFVELGSGVVAGDRVALNISSQIADGDRVNAVDGDKPVVSGVAPTGGSAVVVAH